jgi:hypothetical protein
VQVIFSSFALEPQSVFKNGRRHEEGGFLDENHFLLVTSAATAFATILELTLRWRSEMFKTGPNSL